jgi:hypothetical protein
MADDGFMVQIDEDLAESVKTAAAAKGIPVEMFVRDALAFHIFAEAEWSEDPDPAIDEQIFDNAVRTGATIPWEEIAPWVRSWGTVNELPPPKWRK